MHRSAGDDSILILKWIPVNWTQGRAAHSVRSLPLQGGGSGWGSSRAEHDPRPTASLRVAVTSPFQGEVTELAARVDFRFAGNALAPPEQAFDIAELQFDIGRPAVVALPELGVTSISRSRAFISSG